jgi:hypothetical protein
MPKKRCVVWMWEVLRRFGIAPDGSLAAVTRPIQRSLKPHLDSFHSVTGRESLSEGDEKISWIYSFIKYFYEIHHSSLTSSANATSSDAISPTAVSHMPFIVGISAPQVQSLPLSFALSPLVTLGLWEDDTD